MVSNIAMVLYTCMVVTGIVLWQGLQTSVRLSGCLFAWGEPIYWELLVCVVPFFIFILVKASVWTMKSLLHELSPFFSKCWSGVGMLVFFFFFCKNVSFQCSEKVFQFHDIWLHFETKRICYMKPVTYEKKLETVSWIGRVGPDWMRFVIVSTYVLYCLV